MSDESLIVDYDPVWPELFDELGERLRRSLGGLAVRIDLRRAGNPDRVTRDHGSTRSYSMP